MKEPYSRTRRPWSASVVIVNNRSAEAPGSLERILGRRGHSKGILPVRSPSVQPPSRVPQAGGADSRRADNEVCRSHAGRPAYLWWLRPPYSLFCSPHIQSASRSGVKRVRCAPILCAPVLHCPLGWRRPVPKRAYSRLVSTAPPAPICQRELCMSDDTSIAVPGKPSPASNPLCVPMKTRCCCPRATATP